MRLNQVVDYIFHTWVASQERGTHRATPTLLLGPPGTGKTSCSRVLSPRMTEYMRNKHGPDYPAALHWELDLSSKEASDIGGIPFRVDQTEGDFSTTFTRFAPIEEWEPFTREGAYGVIVLDDIAAADKTVAIAARQLVLERRIGSMRLAPGVELMITGNRREDKSGASLLPAHFRNSCCIIEMQLSLTEWQQWYRAQEYVEPSVPFFLEFRKSYFSQLPKDADSELGSFATPRTWFKVGRELYDLKRMKTDPDTFNFIRRKVAAGLVGNGPASEYIAYMNLRSTLASPDAVLDNPKAALPDPERILGGQDMDKYHALSHGLAETASERLKHGNYKPGVVGQQLFNAIYHCFDHKREYGPTALQHFFDQCPPGAGTNELSATISGGLLSKEIRNSKLIIGFLHDMAARSRK